MAKPRTHFLCRSCGGVQSRWMGKCPDCGTWDALERYVEPKVAAGAVEHAAMASAWVAEPAGDDDRAGAAAPVAEARRLREIAEVDCPRRPTGVGELDRVLGGGFVPGSVVLLGGDPGIGKSTLLLQAAASLARGGTRVLYVSSEESAQQTRLRAERLLGEGAGVADAALDDLYLLAETGLPRIVEQARRIRPDVLVLDSIQMVHDPAAESSPGSIGQLRRCATELVCLAKVSGMAVALVGHVTKDGQFAGPKLLEHLVDTVLSFEGDHHHAHRVVRGMKNRFGTTLEVGLFEMTGRGLNEVRDLGDRLDPAAPPRPGSVPCPVLQGTRCLLVEIQALTAAGFPGSAKRRTSGLDGSRLAVLIAVLEQHGGIRLADQDVFASAAGGMRIMEPAADLALCLAIAGSHYRTHLPPGVAAVGEVGLGGEIRHAPQTETRLREALRRGYRRVLLGPGHGGTAGLDVDLIVVRTIAEAMEHLGAAAAVP